jgi:hypothetical protein
VPGYVREGLLTDAIQGRLDARRQRAAAVHGSVAGGCARLRLPPLYEGFEGLRERASFERGGPEVKHRAPGLLKVGAGEGERAAQRFVRLLRAGVQQDVSGLELQRGGGQALGQGVVDLARQPVSLLDYAEPGAPGEEPGPFDGYAEQVADGVEKLEVFGTEAPPVRAGDVHYAELLVPCVERDAGVVAEAVGAVHEPVEAAAGEHVDVRRALKVASFIGVEAVAVP